VHDGVDLVMPVALGRGRLVLSIETPPVGVVSACVAASGEFRQRAPGEPIVIDVIDGRQYRLRLHVEGAADTHWESDILEVDGKAGVQELSVAALRPARPHLNGFSCGAGGASEP
jgi:hypothetical protein